MRVKVQFSEEEYADREKVLADDPDAVEVTDKVAHEIAYAITWRMGLDGVGNAVDGVDLLAPDGAYIYTLAGNEPRGETV